jgi:hypothetical protein
MSEWGKMIFNRFVKPLLAAGVALGASAVTSQPAMAQAPALVVVGSYQSPSSSSCYVSSSSQGSSSSSSVYGPGCYGTFQQDILNGMVGNIVTGVRDQIHQRLATPTTSAAPLRFTGEEADDASRNFFAAQGASDPFNALAYAKVYTKAPPPAAAPQWIYGANLVGAGDEAAGFNTNISVGTVTGAFDVTKIGIFTTNDALTFVGTASGSWAHAFSPAITNWNSTTPAGSGTLSYLNGAFSADLTILASGTDYNAAPTFVAPTNNSIMSVTANGQYRFDFPYSVFVEPTGGLTYTSVYTSSFGNWEADYTELHAGARAGTEIKWMGFTIEPTISGSVFRIVENTISTDPIAASILPAVPEPGFGFRGSGKITVLWTEHFSSFIEAHATGVAGVKTLVNPAAAFFQDTGVLQTTGAQGGFRYTW